MRAKPWYFRNPPEGFVNAHYGNLMIPIYYQDEPWQGCSIEGRNWCWDQILDWVSWLDVNVWCVPYFKFYVEKDATGTDE